MRLDVTAECTLTHLIWNEQEVSALRSERFAREVGRVSRFNFGREKKERLD